MKRFTTALMASLSTHAARDWLPWALQGQPPLGGLTPPAEPRGPA